MQYWIDSVRKGEQLAACSDKLFTLLLHPLLSVMVQVMNSNKNKMVRKTFQYYSEKSSIIILLFLLI